MAPSRGPQAASLAQPGSGSTATARKIKRDGCAMRSPIAAKSKIPAAVGASTMDQDRGSLEPKMVLTTARLVKVGFGVIQIAPKAAHLTSLNPRSAA